jgi:hypothetical protein
MGAEKESRRRRFLAAAGRRGAACGGATRPNAPTLEITWPAFPALASFLHLARNKPHPCSRGWAFSPGTPIPRPPQKMRRGDIPHETRPSGSILQSSSVAYPCDFCAFLSCLFNRLASFRDLFRLCLCAAARAAEFASARAATGAENPRPRRINRTPAAILFTNSP